MSSKDTSHYSLSILTRKYPSLIYQDKKDSIANLNPSLNRDTITGDTIKQIDYNLTPEYTTTIKGVNSSHRKNTLRCSCERC